MNSEFAPKKLFHDKNEKKANQGFGQNDQYIENFNE